jgi:leucyl aminopeptidase (aminopeptidase T)
MNHADLARQILDVCLRVKRGDRIWIDSWDHTIDLASQIASYAEKRGCEVLLTLKPEEYWLRLIRQGPEHLLERPTRQQIAALQESDCYIFTLGPRRPIDWSSIPLRRRRLATIWFLESNSFVKRWKSVAMENGVKMLGIEATLATEERATAFGLDYQNYADCMYSGCMADYRKIAKMASKLSSFLSGNGKVTVKTPRGTDLSFRLDDRLVEVSDGILTRARAEKGEVVHIPSGSIGVTVDEESGEGTVVYDNPILTRTARIENLRFRVKSGRIVEYSASSGIEGFAEYFENSKSRGQSDLVRFGYFGFGLNPNLRLGYTQDDKVLGMLEVNFGSNERRGGKNKGSGDWWGTFGDATVVVDEQTIMTEGRFTIF